MEIFILLLMIFLHVIADFSLQGILADMKQKAWWKLHGEYTDLYKNDYLVALIAHSFSWTFIVMLPIFALYNFNVDFTILMIFVLNAIIHGITDDIKANHMAINLVADQIVHISQIAMLFITLVI